MRSALSQTDQHEDVLRLTGLDYFGARYFSAAQGRFTSPDRINLTSKRLLNPSNTLNKYVYAANNPLKYVDSDGEDITLFYKPGLRGFPLSLENGHMALTAFNQKTGAVATLSEYPDVPASALTGTVKGYNSPALFPGQVIEEGFSSLTIRTTPDEAQKVIDWIGKIQ